MGEKAEKGKAVKLVKYVGESARSCFERGNEHLEDMRQFKVSSHLLKHCLLFHEKEDPKEISFRMKAVKFHKSAFERQIHESVRIQNSREAHVIMNSKAEYNRCAVPRLGLKMGEREFKQRKEKEEEEIEESLERRIRQLKKENSKERRKNQPNGQPRPKKQKMGKDFEETKETKENENKGKKRKFAEQENIERFLTRTKTKKTTTSEQGEALVQEKPEGLMAGERVKPKTGTPPQGKR